MYGGYVQLHNISQKGYYINPLVICQKNQSEVDHNQVF
jgi:hypothetical protein